MWWLGEHPPRRGGARLGLPPGGPQGLPEPGRNGQGALSTEHLRTLGAQGGCFYFVMLLGAKRKLQKYEEGGMFRIKDGQSFISKCPEPGPWWESKLRMGCSEWGGPAQPRALGDRERVCHDDFPICETKMLISKIMKIRCNLMV